MPQFTSDYFRSNAPVWEHLFRRLGWRADEPKVVVEIGSYEGSSAMWIAHNLLKAAESRLYCIDFWEGEGAAERFARFERNIAELPDPEKLVVMKSRSFDALVRLAQEGVRADFIYVDGSHAAPDVLSDLVLSFGLLKNGGLIICDDYLWSDPRYGGSDIVGRPKIAIDAFTTIYARKLRILGGLPNVQIAFQRGGD